MRQEPPRSVKEISGEIYRDGEAPDCAFCISGVPTCRRHPAAGDAIIESHYRKHHQSVCEQESRACMRPRSQACEDGDDEREDQETWMQPPERSRQDTGG